MKKIYALLLLTVCLATGLVQSQPVTTVQLSTEANPVWYNMNSAATAGANAGMGFAEHATLGTIVKGTVPVTPATIHPDQNKDSYLWRFEDDGSGNVHIINKTGFRIDHPGTAASAQRVLMTMEGKPYTLTEASGISTNNVSGTAFYFTPVDAEFAAVGRLNCDGATKELVLFKAGTNGDILQTGGKGSLFWLYEVAMKSVSVSSSGTGSGMAIIMNDLGEPEAVSSVSKAQTLAVVVRASANVGSVFEGWKDVATGDIVSTDGEYSYTGTEDIALEAVFTLDSATSLNNATASALSFYPNPARGIVTCSADVTSTQLYSQTGQLVLETQGNRFDVSGLAPGVYVVKMNTSERFTRGSVLVL